MTRLRPLIALFTALTFLFALPAAGAEAKNPGAKRHHKAKAKKHKKRCKATKAKRGKKGKKARKHAKKRCAKKPGAVDQRQPGGSDNAVQGGTEDEPVTVTEDTTKRIGRISAVDGSRITVALDKGGSITGEITEDTDLMCKASVDAADDDDNGPVGAPGDDGGDDDPADEDDGDDDFGDGDDDGERRATRQASAASVCHPAVGDPVYEAELDDFSDSAVFSTLDLYGA